MGSSSRLWLLAAVVCLFAGTSSIFAEPDWVKQAAAVEIPAEIIGDAPSVLVIDAKESEIRDNGEIKSKRRHAVRIINSQGIANGYFSEYISPKRKVKSLKGWRVSPDGETFDLSKDDIAEVAVDLLAGYYDEHSTLTAFMPNVTPGDLVAYEYEIEEKSFGGGFHDTYRFQRSLPVVRAEYAVEVPDGWELHTTGRGLEPVSARVAGNIYTWSAADLAFRDSEPYMPAWSRVSRILRVKAYQPGSASGDNQEDWFEASWWAWELHRHRAEVTDTIRSLAADLCADAGSRTDSVQALTHWVRDQVRYVAVEMDRGGYEPREAVTTCRNQFGDCKDKVTLARALLSAIGVESLPVLASTDAPIDPDFPSPFQFNHVILALPAAAAPDLADASYATVGDWLYFDPTDNRIALGKLPSVLYGSYVLPLTDTTTNVVQLPTPPPDYNRRAYEAAVRFQPDLRMTASIRVCDHGNWAASLVDDVASESTTDQIDAWLDRFAASINSPAIERLESGTDGDSAWTSFTLTGEVPVTTTGDMTFLKADLFHADRADDLKRKDRQHPVTLGRPAVVTTHVTWTAPPGLTFEPAVDSIQKSCAIAELLAVTTAADSVFTYQCSTTYRGGSVPPEDYRSARAFLRSRLAAYKMRALLLK